MYLYNSNYTKCSSFCEKAFAVNREYGSQNQGAASKKQGKARAMKSGIALFMLLVVVSTMIALYCLFSTSPKQERRLRN